MEKSLGVVECIYVCVCVLTSTVLLCISALVYLYLLITLGDVSCRHILSYRRGGGDPVMEGKINMRS